MYEYDQKKSIVWIVFKCQTDVSNVSNDITSSDV